MLRTHNSLPLLLHLKQQFAKLVRGIVQIHGFPHARYMAERMWTTILLRDCQQFEAALEYEHAMSAAKYIVTMWWKLKRERRICLGNKRS